MTERGAIESIAETLDYTLFYEHDLPMLGLDGPQIKAIADDLAQRILDRLTADGYSVVKTVTVTEDPGFIMPDITDDEGGEDAAE